MSNAQVLDKPLKLTISITHECNLDCQPCYADCHSIKTRNELSTSEVLAFIDYLDKEGFVQVHYEGGEPFTRPDFMDIVRHTTPRMLTWVRTNGTLITPEIARELADAKVGAVCVDIWGATQMTHEALTKSTGSFNLACRAVEYLSENGVEVIMTIILNRQNIDELQDYLQLAERLGAKSVGLLRLYPLGRAKREWSELAVSIDHQMQAIRALHVPDKIKLMQSWHPKDGNCCWQSAAINAYGDSIGCVYLRDYVNYGNIRQDDFIKTWEHPVYKLTRAGNVEKSCPDCSSSQGSSGGCRSTAYAFHGRWTAPDPYCEVLNDGTDITKLPEPILQSQSES